MPIYLKAIVPKRFKQPDLNTPRLALLSFGRDVQSNMQTYPPWMPWKSRPPKTGLRAGGKRTGDLGRAWSLRWDSPYSLTVGNPTEYAGYVQGYRGHGGMGQRQVSALARRGWISITDVVSRLWPKHLGQFKTSFKWK